MTEQINERPAFLPGPPASAVTLGALQRAYLIGDVQGLELRSPARYYLAADLNVDAVPGMQQRLDRVVRANPMLRLRVEEDLTPTPIAADAIVAVSVLEAAESAFEAVDGAVADEFRSDTLEFDAWPQMRITVVRSAARARVHLVYAMWMMDGAALQYLLAALVSPDGTGVAFDPVPAAVAAEPSPHALRRRHRDEDFWRALAATLPEAAEVPLRPGWRQSGRSVDHRMLHIDVCSASVLAEQGRRHGLTLPMIFLTVYGMLLGAVGGGRSHTVTVVRSNRRADGTDPAIGNYGSSVPMAIPARAGRDFVTVAHEVQRRFLEQSLHTSSTGIDIGRLTDPSGDRRRLAHPFAFTAVELDSEREAALGVRRDWDTIQLRVPQVLLDHQVGLESDGSIRLGFDWRTDAFDAGFMVDFIEQYRGAVTELTVGDGDWNDLPEGPTSPSAYARPQYGSARTLHERIMRTAERVPDAAAVRDADGELTYALLAAAATDLAQRLIAAGAEMGDHVGVHLPRGRGQVVAILGALLADCAYIPLDLGLPGGRLDRITRQARMRYVVTDGTVAAADRWRDRAAIPVAVSATAGPSEASHSTIAGRGGCATAYVIFTSGSTGEPKGVRIRHSAALNTIDAVNELIGLTPADRVLSVSSLGFDLSVYDVFGPLLVGATVVMLSEDTARTPAAWARLIGDHAVTIWNSAPALAALLVEEGGALPSIRSYLLSGDWIPLHLPEALRQLSEKSEVISLGGATEGSIWSIYHRITRADSAGRSVPYGKPLAGQDILVLDAQRRPCPRWHIGEIYIAGAGVADGYLNDPDRTAVAFTDDPAYGWIYRTGDLGRRGVDDVVEFLGRVDSQVKVNGHRIELGEIESVLAAKSYVRRSAASVAGDGNGVVGYVTVAEDAPATWQADCMAALREELPSYMVPYALVGLDEIPLTGNGKVDHQRLRTVAPTAGPVAELPAVALVGLHVQEVSACWAEILGTPAGADSFFEAGGGSLDAIRLLSLLRNRFGYQVPFGRFLADPTVPGLAALCANARSAASSAVWSHTPRSVPRPRGRVVLFPPVGGGVACYAGLIRHLPGDIDVHVIGFDRPFDPLPDTAPTLAVAAERCLDSLPPEFADSDVPCVFAGWSFGGALAVEAARSASDRVRRVVVMDTPVSPDARGGAGTEPAMRAEFIDDIREAGGVVVTGTDLAADPALLERFEVYRQNIRLLRSWQPVRVPVPVVELRAAVRPAEPDLDAWGRWVTVVQAVVLRGAHFDVLDATNMPRIQHAIEGGFR
ncbi:amino acid adenylation domain-containing protein [Nocardia sp. NPDC056064]|uniref:non-ribosomal peptide synthetase n=1 Tax=Nocardia sp. NPDC056064 TaxID=3345701 RepID=UPI0035DBE403